MDLPVFLWHESADFLLALNYQAHGHRLYSACTQASCNLCPQQWRNHITNNAIEKATRLLGINPVDIELGGSGKGFLNRLFGNFVENDALVARVVATNRLAQMPGYRLPFAVKVGREIDGVGIGGQLFQVADDFFFAGQYFIARLPAFFRVNAHSRHQLLTRLFLFVARFLFRRHFAR